jgi:glycosyltransferase involved in cell wall biosynthesis
MPRVSVVMSVYNAERYVEEAIESILGQTFRDFEFIIVDDGSTDTTSEILHNFDDERIMLVENDGNIGLTRSLNKGLQMARGKYIARMDADDISLYERLEKQVQFLDTHPDVGLVGSAVIYIDPDGKELGVQRVCTENIHQALLNVEFCWWHSATAFRSECLESVGPYREGFRYAQDYDLWLRIAEKYDVASLSEPLVKLRLHPESISVARRTHQRTYVLLAVELAKQRRATGWEDLDALLGGIRETAPDSLPTLTLEEFGHAYLRTACLDYQVGEIAKAKTALTEAISHAPALLRETDRFLQSIVYYGLTYATTLTSRLGALQFIDTVFSNLPPAAEGLAGLKSRAIGQVYAITAFENYAAGNPLQVRHNIVRAVYHDPSWLANKGLFSIFVESLVGKRTMNWMRRLKRQLMTGKIRWAI